MCFFLIVIATSVHLLQPSVPAAPMQEPTREEMLKVFLKKYVMEKYRPRKEDQLRYLDAFVDLDDDGNDEAIVYLVGPNWCGSGGCSMLVLTPAPSSPDYRVIVHTTITRTPIRVLQTSSHGWRDVGVWVQGGGIQPGYEAILRHDGKTYPSNPSTVPPTQGKTPSGKVLISDGNFEDGKQLLP
jgi:hypothetical protein